MINLVEFSEYKNGTVSINPDKVRSVKPSTHFSGFVEVYYSDGSHVLVAGTLGEVKAKLGQ